MIRLVKATPNQIRYACKKYHYAKSVPSVQVAFSCYEDDVFLGVIAYGVGSNNNIVKSFGLYNGQILELVRVALNGKQKAPTSKFLATSIRLLKKQKPMLKMLVSYADITNQNHKGVIYKATNWLYDGISKTNKDAYYVLNGKLIHGRSMRARYGKKENFPPETLDAPTQEKHRFLYFYDNELKLKYTRNKCSSDTPNNQLGESGAEPTIAHQSNKQ